MHKNFSHFCAASPFLSSRQTDARCANAHRRRSAIRENVIAVAARVPSLAENGTSSSCFFATSSQSFCDVHPHHSPRRCSVPDFAVAHLPFRQTTAGRTAISVFGKFAQKSSYVGCRLVRCVNPPLRAVSPSIHTVNTTVSVVFYSQKNTRPPPHLSHRLRIIGSWTFFP